MILTVFRLTLFLDAKIDAKLRNRPDCTSPIRGAIAPADDSTLRCNHSTSHVNEARARRKALKSRQRAILINLEA